MLSFNIMPVCKARGIKSPYTLLMSKGFTHAVARDLAAGKVGHIKLSHMERLCQIFSCTPHDLLEWHPKDGQSIDSPLAVLLPTMQTGFEWINEVKNLPLDKIKALGDLVKNELEK